MNAAVRRPMASKIHRIITGDYVSPGGPDHDAGERVVTVAYLVNHPDARILFDTGFPLDAPFSVTEGGHELVTYPRSILITLDTMGVALDAIDAVVNCHLHIDHAGGNFRMPPELPIYAQSLELQAARGEQAPLVQDALALGTHHYVPLDGERELLPGVRVIPTPGHTDGHQSMAVNTLNGLFLLAGQATPTASRFASAMYAWQLARKGYGPPGAYPGWLGRVAELGPIRVAMAHDLAVWSSQWPE